MALLLAGGDAMVFREQHLPRLRVRHQHRRRVTRIECRQLSSSSVDDDNCGGCPVRCCAVRKGNDFLVAACEGGSARASNRLAAAVVARRIEQVPDQPLAAQRGCSAASVAVKHAHHIERVVADGEWTLRGPIVFTFERPIELPKLVDVRLVDAKVL